MSVTTVTLGPMLLLEKHGMLGPSETVCDFGSMEFDSRVPENNLVFEALFRSRGFEIPKSFYDAETGRLYGTAGDYWRALGWEYASYDIDGRFGSMVCDLNVDRLPESEYEKFTLTMNGGTSEHVFNQSNFFLQAHNVTKVGGLMLHVVPYHLSINHGFYQYEPILFHSLAHYNGYELLGLWHCGKGTHDLYRTWRKTPSARKSVLIALMRRVRAEEFVFPLQLNEPMVLSTEAEERYGAFVRQAIGDFQPSPELPEEFHLDIPTATIHEGPIPKKLLKRGLPAAGPKKLAAPRKRPSLMTNSLTRARRKVRRLLA